jgi:ERCC4-type nuclease
MTLHVVYRQLKRRISAVHGVVGYQQRSNLMLFQRFVYYKKFAKCEIQVIVDMREFNCELPLAIYARGIDIVPVTLDVCCDVDSFYCSP